MSQLVNPPRSRHLITCSRTGPNKLWAFGSRPQRREPEISAGLTYRFISNWFLGLETRYATELADANIHN